MLIYVLFFDRRIESFKPCLLSVISPCYQSLGNSVKALYADIKAACNKPDYEMKETNDGGGNNPDYERKESNDGGGKSSSPKLFHTFYVLFVLFLVYL